MKKLENGKGITLIALIITIIVLLILAGITIGMLTSNNGILKKAQDAKKETKISKELEDIKISSAASLINSSNENIDISYFENDLKDKNPNEIIQVKKKNDEIKVYYLDEERLYIIDDKGVVTGPFEVDRAQDANPGNIKTDKDGNALSGSSLETAYEINCIEDLCAFSNEAKSNMFLNKYIKLMIDLDFDSKLSYIDGNIGVEGTIPNFGNIDELMDYLTNKDGVGFYPIALESSGSFGGVFEGNNKSIDNLYINLPTTQYVGFFSKLRKDATIRNISISGKIIGNSGTAGICGFTGTLGSGQSNFYNCINNCNIEGTGGIGGIIGYEKANGPIINNCVNNGVLNGSSGNIGGILGQTDGGCNIINSYNTGDINGTTNLGGIIGYGYNGFTIYNCYNTGNITASGSTSKAGGIVGNMHYRQMNLINCYNIGTVTGTAGAISGGTEIGEEYTILKSLYCTMNNQTNWINQKAIVYTESEFKSNTVKNLLNNFIENPTDDIDTTGYCKWEQTGNKFPYINPRIEWNGTTWIEK